ncbi:Bacterial alpha-L-rhamnosidase [Pirellulimonas nuda]|uniref:alpha-L-rhamnosidase n=1 Tax=Pirellulimonas nuda TaxID=2528009 RepID=A0A518DC10_9BACT|nr:family 78 glycoside hydrolase catalytic domain [Pirellulimonas nuda]QDU88966.1 Bacterial alpha-L-rhamnosidase [Pirellulimonas nuda]
MAPARARRARLRFAIVAIFSTAAALAEEAPTLRPAELRCEGLESPPAVDTPQPRLSWLCESGDPEVRGQAQSAYQIIVADSSAGSAADEGNLWDSGKIVSDQSTFIAYAGAALQPHREYFWKVRIWNRDAAASEWSPPAAFSMGFLPPNSWRPDWIRGDGVTYLLRKPFPIKKDVKRAYVYASALGVYELRLNGSKVGDELFAPGWTDYRKRVQYQRYDVTDAVHRGDNVLGAELAPGWFSGKIAWFNAKRYGKQPAFAAELHLEFADGSSRVVSTDGSWETSSGPLTASDMQDGDQYDARLEKIGWDTAGYQGADWENAEVLGGESRIMAAQRDQPVGDVRTLTPVQRTQPAPGVYVYDLGQNITGIARITARGQRDAKITLRYAERLNADGTLDVTNLKLAEATDTYVMRSAGAETYQPKFTFHGFRWVSVEGLDAPPALDEVTGVVVGTLFPETGSLSTSSQELNQLLSNIRWTIRNSYLSVPLDSPQRSERLGWTGDANVMAATASWMFGLDRFYSKWQTDILDAQSYGKGETDGAMPNVAPRWMAKASGRGGGWGDVGVNLPYLLWKRYGDTGVIRASYSGTKKWLAFLERNSKNHIIPVSARVSTAGDWENAGDPTPKDLVGTFYYALDVAQVAEMAEALGEEADAAAYRARFQEIRAAIIKRYVAQDGVVANGSQTAQVFALYLGLYPQGMKDKVFRRLIDNIEKRDNHISTGYLGSQWLLKVLVENGRPDVAYDLLMQRTGPSWLYMASNEQTSLWEGWDTLNPDGTFGSKRTSLGHAALGSCGDWMFQRIGGITPDPLSPGFKHFMIEPLVGGGLTHAEANFQSPHGLIGTRWTLHGDRFTLDVTVPVNTTATVLLPPSSPGAVTESDQPIDLSDHVLSKRLPTGGVSYHVGSGRYSYAASGVSLSGRASRANEPSGRESEDEMDPSGSP